MLLPKFLSRKISPEKSLDFLSQKSVVRPALHVLVSRVYAFCSYIHRRPVLMPTLVLQKRNLNNDICVNTLKLNRLILTADFPY